jgi:surfactin synthase thioesterase subunit
MDRQARAVAAGTSPHQRRTNMREVDHQEMIEEMRALDRQEAKWREDQEAVAREAVRRHFGR